MTRRDEGQPVQARHGRRPLQVKIGGVTLWAMNETAKRGTIEPKLFSCRAAPCPWRNANNARKRPSEVALVCKTTVQGNRAQRSRGLIQEMLRFLRPPVLQPLMRCQPGRLTKRSGEVPIRKFTGAS